MDNGNIEEIVKILDEYIKYRDREPSRPWDGDFAPEPRSERGIGMTNELAKVRITAVNIDEALDALTEAFIAIKQKRSSDSEFDYELTMRTDGSSENWRMGVLTDLFSFNLLQNKR